MNIPSKIESGYPSKEFQFTGEFEIIALGNRRAAIRNRKKVKVPVFRAGDGESFLLMTHAQKLDD